MKLPRLDRETKRFYESVLPSDSRVKTKPMFGGLGSFVNGNMFAGALGDQVFLRLRGPARDELLRAPGGVLFEPVAGRVMSEYVVVPYPWKSEPDRVRTWMARSFEWVAAMPPKKKERKSVLRKR